MCVDMGSPPTFLAEIVQRLATDVIYTNALGIGCRGVWIKPNKDGVHYVWRLPWMEGIMVDLVSSYNPQVRITNSYLELAALLLQEATVTFVRTNPMWQAPFTRSNNKTTVAWMFQEASSVILAVAGLPRLRSLINRQFKITSSVFYHSGTQNTMADDSFRKFHLAPDIFLSLFSTT